jgi:polysaccharide pyruvyl transferase WcaK-like protein
VDGYDADTPLKVINQIRRCRVIVTGSYHAGVFALSMGVPVVGVAKSQYYIDKFLGLADQFGVGCHVVFFRSSGYQEDLAHAIQRAWGSAEQTRPQLLAAAARQVQLSRAAYRRAFELVKPGRNSVDRVDRGSR